MTDHERLELLYSIFINRAIYWRMQYDNRERADAYDNCATMVCHALKGADDCLAQFDSYEDKNYDEPDDIDSDMGFDPYMGCFTDDC